jgi:hypothetical protein
LAEGLHYPHGFTGRKGSIWTSFKYFGFFYPIRKNFKLYSVIKKRICNFR